MLYDDLSLPSQHQRIMSASGIDRSLKMIYGWIETNKGNHHEDRPREQFGANTQVRNQQREVISSNRPEKSGQRARGKL